MLGDTAVAVHPDNERLKHLIGKTAILPLVGRRIPIVGDDLCRSREGHRRGQDHAGARLQRFRGRPRHHLPMINVLDVEAQARSRRQLRISRGRAGLGRARRDAGAARPRPLRRAQEDRRADLEAQGLLDQDRAAHPHGAAWRPLRRRDRAVPHRPMVRRRQGARGAGDRGGARRAHRVRAEELGEDLFRLDGEHPAVVHLAPAVVGPPDPGLVRAGRQGLRRRDRGRGGVAGARLLRRDRSDHAACRATTWRSSRRAARRS